MQLVLKIDTTLAGCNPYFVEFDLVSYSSAMADVDPASDVCGVGVVFLVLQVVRVWACGPR